MSIPLNKKNTLTVNAMEITASIDYDSFVMFTLVESVPKLSSSYSIDA
jgi:hypothetical protein